MNLSDELGEITKFLSLWATEIALENSQSRYDINTLSESLVCEILNLLFEFELKNLNAEKKNFPGIDLGDLTKKFIAVQVTSQRGSSKVWSTLSTFREKKLDAVFKNGLKIFVLSVDRPRYRFVDSVDFFNPEKDILCFQDIIKGAEQLYFSSREKFSRLKNLLAQEFPFPKSSSLENAVQIDVTQLHDEIFRTFGSNPDFNLKYSLFTAKKWLLIRPETKYWRSIKRHQIVGFVGHWYDLAICAQFPILDMKIFNTSSASIVLTKIELHVIRSRPIRRAEIFLRSIMAPWVFDLVNEGDKTPVRVVIAFNIADNTSKINFENLLPFSRDINLSENSETISIKRELETLGYEPDKIVDVANKTGNYSREDVWVYGVLKYDKKQIPFKIPIHLVEPQAGGDQIPPEEFTIQKLHEDDDNYVLARSTMIAIKPNDGTRINWALSVPKTSLHRFKVKLTFNNFEHETQDIYAYIFVPKYSKDVDYTYYLSHLSQGQIA